MSAKQLRYFKQKLLDWKAEILKEARETLDQLQEGGIQESDLADRAGISDRFGNT